MGYFVAFVVALVLLFCIYVYLQKKIKKKERRDAVDKGELLLPNSSTAQQENVWNISSRVNNYQTAPNANHPWPTHDAHVSLEAIITDPMKDMRPGYNDPPPSYEQAVGSTGPRVDGASSNATAETSSGAADAPSSTAHAPAPGPGVVTAAVVTTAVVRVES